MAGGGKGKMSQAQHQGVLLDTSIWIRYLRRGGDEDIKAEVKRVLLAERVFTCWVVKAELLVRARDDEAFERLSADLEALEEVPITPGGVAWRCAARLYPAAQRAYRSASGSADCPSCHGGETPALARR